MTTSTTETVLQLRSNLTAQREAKARAEGEMATHQAALTQVLADYGVSSIDELTALKDRAQRDADTRLTEAQALFA